MDALRVELSQTSHRGVALTGRERARILRGLSDDERQTFRCLEADGLVSGRMTGCGKHANVWRDFDVSGHALVARALEVEPLGDGVALVPGDIPLGLLH